MFSWEVYIQAFVLGAFPWMSQLRRLDFHFEFPNIKIKPISNLFASIFSMGLFLYIRGTLPKTVLSDFAGWGLFLGIAFISVIIYFIVFTKYREKVKIGRKKPALVVNFILYLVIWLALTSAFGILTTYAQNYVMSGNIVDKVTEKGIEHARLYILDINQDIITSDHSDTQGEVLLVLKKDKLSSCKFIKVEADNYTTLKQIIQDTSNLEEEMKLLKIPKND